MKARCHGEVSNHPEESKGKSTRMPPLDKLGVLRQAQDDKARDDKMR